MPDPSPLNGGSSNSTTPQTTQNRCSVAAEPTLSPKASCEVITGTSSQTVERCDEPGYMVLKVDGHHWTICREHYEGVR